MTDDQLIQRARADIERRGLAPVANDAGVTPFALSKFVSKMPMSKATVFYVRHQLTQWAARSPASEPPPPAAA